ncbi:MAG: SDR family oxidoreductase [Micromonosporaceae bacterium]
MTSTILVTGGTGTLGRRLTPLLREADCKLRVLSRGHREPADGVDFVTGDLSTGEGVAAAVDGVDTVVHCAGGQKGDTELARRLVQAASRAGVRHLVYISVVGADRVPVVSRTDRAMFGYVGEKRAAELIVSGSGVPWTTLRATQFHELMFTMAQAMAKLPMIPVPTGTRVQPIDAGEVATRLAELALGEPAGLVPDIAGPRAYPLKDLIGSYLRATGRHRLMLPVRLPGGAARAFRAGANLAPDRAVGHRTWEDFLAAQLR